MRYERPLLPCQIATLTRMPILRLLPQNLLSTYEVSQAGLAQSTVSDQMRKRYLILLTPKEGESEEKEGDEEIPTPSTPTDSHQKDYILLDIKEVRSLCVSSGYAVALTKCQCLLCFCSRCEKTQATPFSPTPTPTMASA